MVYFQKEGFNPANGEPMRLTEQQRNQGMRVAEHVLGEMVDNYGVFMTDYVVRVMFLGLFVTGIAHGLAPNLVMNDFERRVTEMRERLTMLIEGKMKIGEVGPDDEPTS